MNAFHNDQKVKETYLTRVRAHRLADEIIKGKYWDGGKGCAVGCTIHGSEHFKYETELGIPRWLAHVEDKIFEGLSIERSKSWPEEFLSAINIGAELDKVKIPFLIFVVESAREKVDKAKYHKTIEYIDGVLAELKRDPIDLGKLRKARSAAYAAAYADAAAAYAAADAADAAYADAAYAAAAAAGRAARENEFEKFADKLLELLKACQ